MIRRKLLLGVAALSYVISFSSLAEEGTYYTEAAVTESETEPTSDIQTETDTSLYPNAESQPSLGETASESPIERAIKTYEQSLAESTLPGCEGTTPAADKPAPETESVSMAAETASLYMPQTADTIPKAGQQSEPAVETDQAQTDLPETEPVTEFPAESESETELETEIPDYIEVPSEEVTEEMQEIYSFLCDDLELNHAAACGVIANMKYESGCLPASVGDGGSSYGLCQWHNERYAALRNYCVGNGYDSNTISGQMKFLANELQNGYSSVLDYLNSVPDSAQGACDAAYYWCKHYEVPANADACAAERASYANTLYGKSFTYIKTTKKAVTDIKHEILENAFDEATDTEVYASIIHMIRPKK